MSQKTLRILGVACLVLAAAGVFTLMLKNPEDNFLTIPTFLLIMAALSLGSLKLKK